LPGQIKTGVGFGLRNYVRFKKSVSQKPGFRMKKSYLGNYLKTYLWQAIGMVLNLASMFIVIPMITNNKVVYGVYSVCISTAMFLSYADLGFVTAGVKYAGENYAKGNHESEVKYYGFSGFVLFVFIAIIAGVYFLFAYSPSLLIKDIGNSEYLSIASKLLLIQAIFSFNTVSAQRLQPLSLEPWLNGVK